MRERDAGEREVQFARVGARPSASPPARRAARGAGSRRLNPCAMAKMPKLSSLLVWCRTRCEACRIMACRCAVLFGRVHGGLGRRVEDVAVADDGGGPALVLGLELTDFIAGSEGRG